MELNIIKCIEGGFLVIDRSGEAFQRGMQMAPLFAGSLDDCLDFMRRKLRCQP